MAAVLKPDRFIRASLSLACCSTSQKGASQGTLSPSPADSRDPAVPKTILDVEVVTREAQVFVPSACLYQAPNAVSHRSHTPCQAHLLHRRLRPWSVRQCEPEQPCMVGLTPCKSMVGCMLRLGCAGLGRGVVLVDCAPWPEPRRVIRPPPAHPRKPLSKALRHSSNRHLSGLTLSFLCHIRHVQ